MHPKTSLVVLCCLLLLAMGSPVHSQTQPGYPVTVLSDPMDGETHWDRWTQDSFTSQIENGKLRLQFTGANSYAWSLADQLGPLKDVYIETEAQVERPSTFTEMGLMFRVVPTPGGLVAFTYMVSSEGKFRFGLSTPNGFTVIRDWQIIGLPQTPTVKLGVLVKENTFTLLYNGETLGSFTSDENNAAGQVGLLVGTGPGASTTASVLYDNVLVSAPDTETIIKIPNALQNSERAGSLIIEELQAAKVIPASARLVFSIPQTFLNNYTEGLSTFRIAKPLLLQDSLTVMDMSWDSSKPAIACGVALRMVDETTMQTIYLDRFGAFALYQFVRGKLMFSRYAPFDGIRKDNQATNRIIVVSLGTMTTLYVNGRWAGTLRAVPERGAVAMAAYSYDTVSVRCQFDNVSLYSLDS